MVSFVFPRPCDGPLYADWTLEQRLDKVQEEVSEARDALITAEMKGKDSDMRLLWEELTDVIIAATSALEASGCGFPERQEILRQKNMSNAERDHGKRFARD